jgi:hypothetical protein
VRLSLRTPTITRRSARPTKTRVGTVGTMGGAGDGDPRVELVGQASVAFDGGERSTLYWPKGVQAKLGVSDGAGLP